MLFRSLTDPSGGTTFFIPSDLGAAFNGGTAKSGYNFTLAAHPDGNGAQVLAADICGAGVATETEFFATGLPVTPGTTGTRYFAGDQSGMIRQDSAALADMTAGQPLQ